MTSSTHLSPDYIDGLVQDRHNSSALAMELRLSCAKPSISYRIADSQRILEESMYDFLGISVPADVLAPSGARTSAGTVMTKFWALIQYKDVILPV